MAPQGFGRVVSGLLRAVLQPAARAAGTRRRAARPRPVAPAGGGRPVSGGGRAPAGGRAPGGRGTADGAGGVRDLAGGLVGIDLAYRPRDDDRPDPGEVVWAWVPYDEGDGRGKDRPVLVIGRRGTDLVGLPLSSQDHDRDAADEARHGRSWMDVGRGGWDPQGRPSEVRLDRLLLLSPGAARREGAALDRRRFDEVVAAVLARHRATDG